MNKHVIRVNKDTGNLAIVIGRWPDEYIAEKLNIKLKDLTESDIENFMLEDCPPDLYTASYLVNYEDLPPEFDDFQNCSIWKDGKIDFDLEKARKLQLARMRLARKDLLEALDVEFVIALENQLDTKETAQKKQVLRDVTEHLKVKKLNSMNDVLDESAFPEGFTIPKHIATCVPAGWDE